MSQSAKEKFSFQSFSLITIVLFWCGLIVLTSMYITIPLTTVFARAFQVTGSQAAWLGSSFSFCYAMGCLLYGPFSDQYGRKLFLVTSISLLTAVTIASGFVDSFYGLVFLRGLQGLVAAAFAPISLVYAGEIFPPQRRLTVVGFISSGFLISSVAGQVFSGIVAGYFGWQAVFFILGALYFITAWLVVRFLPKETEISTKETLFMKFKRMAALLKNTQLLLTFSITFMLLLSLVGMYTVLGSYLSSPFFNLTQQDILLIRGYGIIGMVLSFFAGQLSQKLGIQTVLKSGLALAATGLFLLGCTTSLPLLVFSSVLFVSGIAVVVPVSITVVSHLAGNARGSAVSFNAFILFMGASAGPPFIMKIVEIHAYQFSFLLLSAVLFAGFCLSFFLNIQHPYFYKK